MGYMENIIEFFQKNKEKMVDFINLIQVNHQKTDIKFGYIENRTVNLAFAIYNELDEKITEYDEKLKCLFNAEIETKEIGSQLHLDKPCKISFTPFLRISDSPIIHAFQITISYEV
jgi:hypothetical protein